MYQQTHLRPSTHAQQAAKEGGKAKYFAERSIRPTCFLGSWKAGETCKDPSSCAPRRDWKGSGLAFGHMGVWIGKVWLLKYASPKVIATYEKLYQSM